MESLYRLCSGRRELFGLTMVDILFCSAVRRNAQTCAPKLCQETDRLTRPPKEEGLDETTKPITDSAWFYIH
jgi:hypothetical protein